MKKQGAEAEQFKNFYPTNRIDIKANEHKMYKFRTTSGENHPNAFGDVVAFCHLRWDFVFQRPQHLLTRCAKNSRVFYVEEPIFSDDGPGLEISKRENNVII